MGTMQIGADGTFIDRPAFTRPAQQISSTAAALDPRDRPSSERRPVRGELRPVDIVTVNTPKGSVQMHVKTAQAAGLPRVSQWRLRRDR
jgi:hypothetical protein